MTIPSIPVLKTVNEVRELRSKYYKNRETVGFIPTMGYLHKGHLSLISKSLDENDHTVVSIFVNPSQFSPNEDLDSYPRDLSHDLMQLNSLTKKIDAVFTPTVNEMYPSGIPMDVSKQKGAFVTVLGVSEQLEGNSRPGFFRGVSTIVTKLFNIVQPTTAYFGQKDIQQTVVIKRLVKDLLMNLEVEIVETVRNESGLALSSRNKYLDDDIRNQVTCLYKSMVKANENYLNGNTDVKNLTEIIKKNIEGTNSNFKIDYISFNDNENLEYLEKIDTNKGCILSLAVFVPNSIENLNNETTRLIDNMIFRPY